MTDATEKRSVLLRSLQIDREEVSEDVGQVRNWVPILLVIIGLLLVALLSVIFGPSLMSSQAEADAKPVVAKQPRKSATAAQGSLVASGYIVARRTATVAAEVTGKVTEVRIDEGQAVTRGQILAVLDRSVIAADGAAAAAQTNSNRAVIAAVQANLVEARRVLQRSEELDKRGFLTKADLTNARTQVIVLEAQLDRAIADTQVARANENRISQQVGRYFIRAPFSGVVTEKNAQAGEIISPISAGGGFTRTGICTLVDMSSLEIEIDVNERFIARIREGQAVHAVMDAYPEDKLEAYVLAIIPTADRARSTVRVRIGFRRLDDRLLPNMAVKVTFLENETRDTKESKDG